MFVVLDIFGLYLFGNNLFGNNLFGNNLFGNNLFGLMEVLGLPVFPRMIDIVNNSRD
jgi:hypothetical protein